MMDTDVNDLAAVVEDTKPHRTRRRAAGVGGLRARPTAAQRRVPAAADPSVARRNDRRPSKGTGPPSAPDIVSDNSVISLGIIRVPPDRWGVRKSHASARQG